LKHGHGVYRWADGRVYVGNWIDGQQDDERVYLFPNGDVKKAKWVDGHKGEYLALSEQEIKNNMREKEEATRAAAAVEAKFREKQ